MSENVSKSICCLLVHALGSLLFVLLADFLTDVKGIKSERKRRWLWLCVGKMFPASAANAVLPRARAVKRARKKCRKRKDVKNINGHRVLWNEPRWQTKCAQIIPNLFRFLELNRNKRDVFSVCLFGSICNIYLMAFHCIDEPKRKGK